MLGRLFLVSVLVAGLHAAYPHHRLIGYVDMERMSPHINDYDGLISLLEQFELGQGPPEPKQLILDGSCHSNFTQVGREGELLNYFARPITCFEAFNVLIFFNICADEFQVGRPEGTTVYDICCICPSPSPTPSTSSSTSRTSSLSPSTTFSRSISPSTTTSPSPTPETTLSPSSDSEFGIPPVTYVSSFGGDGTSGWLGPGTVPTTMTGLFGFSLSSTPRLDEAIATTAGVGNTGEKGLLVGALRNIVDWNDPLMAGAVSTGDLLLANVDSSGFVTERRNSASRMLNALNRIIDIEVDDAFACGVREIADLDGNGVPELVVGSRWSDLNVEQAGSFFLLFMDLVIDIPLLPRLQVVDFYEFGLEVSLASRHDVYVNIPDTFEGTSRNWYLLGNDFADVDFDNDGRQEIIVGMPGCFDCFDADLGSATLEWMFPGAIMVLGLDVALGRTGLNQDSILRFAHAIQREDIELALNRTIDVEAEFGYAIKPFEDITGDGVPEILIGAPGVADERGSIFLASLTYDEGSAQLVFLQEIEPPASLPEESRFGSALDIVPDMNFDESSEVLIGVPSKQLGRDPARGTGFAYLVSFTTSREDLCERYAAANNIPLETIKLFVDCANGASGPFIEDMRTAAFFLRGNFDIVTPEIAYKFVLRIDDSIVPGSSGWDSALRSGDGFGESVASIGDIDGDGNPNIAIGAPYHSGAGLQNEGAVYVFSLTLPSPSVSPTPSVTPSVTPSPSRSTSASASESASLTPSSTPSPSIGACQEKCVVERTFNEFRCAFDAIDIQGSMFLNNNGSLASIDGGAGVAVFEFGSFVDRELWVLARCPEASSNSWTVNADSFGIPVSSSLIWSRFGAVSSRPGTPGIVLLETSSSDCEISQLYFGHSGADLIDSSGLEICNDGPSRGYLCASEISLTPTVLLDMSSMAFVSRLPFPLNFNGRADLRFRWNPDWGLGQLHFYAKCPSGLQNTWKINGVNFDFPVSSNFEWHLFGDYDSNCVSMQPVDTGCEIKFAYLGRDTPNEAHIPACPVDEAKCATEAVFGGFDLTGINGPAISGSCSITQTSDCEGTALYDFGSIRGPLWIYAKCPSEEENTWMVEDHLFDVPVSADFDWHFFGNVECDRVFLSVIEKHCEIGQLFRGYFSPFTVDCNCPWERQEMYVIEGLGEAEFVGRTGFGTLQQIDANGYRINGVCGVGFQGATQVARDSAGNFYVADSLASQIIRIEADCSDQRVVVEWPTTEVGRPEGVAVGHIDSILYVADSTRASIYQITLNSDGAFQDISLTPFPPGHYSSIEVIADGTVYAAGTRSILYWHPASDVVETLVSEAVLAVDVVDIAMNNACAGLYFTTNNNQLWHCADREDGRTCYQFCRELVDSSTCVYLRHPYGVSVDCTCTAYVTSQVTGGLVSYSPDGMATELTSALVLPKDLFISFDDGVYGDLCCHTPLPTRPPMLPSVPNTDSSIPLVPLVGPCVQNVNCMWGTCQDDNTWCDCVSFAFGCECDIFSGQKPNPYECIDSDPPVRIEPHVPCESCSTQVLFGVSDFTTVFRAALDIDGDIENGITVCQQFINVFDIELDSEGGVFVADFGGGSISRISPDCSETALVTQWPTHRIASPQSIMIKDGALFVADSGTNTIWRVRVKADFSVRDLQPIDTSLVFVTKLEDGPGNTFYAIELGNQLSVFDLDTRSKTVLVSAADRIVGLADIAISSCGVFLSLPELNQVWGCSYPVSSDTCDVLCEQSSGDSCSGLEDPSGLAIGCDCRVYAANSGNGVIMRYNNGTIPRPGSHVLEGASGLKDIEILSTC